jgi:hypothetical protein
LNVFAPNMETILGATYVLDFLGLAYFFLASRTVFGKGLRKLPVPFIARFIRLCRASIIIPGDAPGVCRALHAK